MSTTHTQLSTAIDELVTHLLQFILKNDVESVTKLVSKGIELCNNIPNLSQRDKLLALKLSLQRIARGKDNVEGTGDDYLSPAVMNMLCLLLDNIGLFEEFIGALSHPKQSLKNACKCGCI